MGNVGQRLRRNRQLDPAVAEILGDHRRSRLETLPEILAPRLTSDDEAAGAGQRQLPGEGEQTFTGCGSRHIGDNTRRGQALGRARTDSMHGGSRTEAQIAGQRYGVLGKKKDVLKTCWRTFGAGRRYAEHGRCQGSITGVFQSPGLPAAARLGPGHPDPQLGLSRFGYRRQQRRRPLLDQRESDLATKRQRIFTLAAGLEHAAAIRRTEPGEQPDACLGSGGVSPERRRAVSTDARAHRPLCQNAAGHLIFL